MRVIAAVVLLGLSHAAADGQTIIARDHQFRRQTMAGQEVRIFTYTNFHRDCAPDLPPRIVVRGVPGHGQFDTRPGSTTVTVLREGTTDCTGRTYAGVAVFYTPSQGFHGTDHFEWDVINNSTVGHDSAVVEVR